MTCEVEPCGTGAQHSEHMCKWCPTWWSTAAGAKTHGKSCQSKPRKFGAASGTAKATAKKKAELYYQNCKSKVTCEGTPVNYVVEFPYLGCMLAGNGADLVDVLYRLAGAAQTWIKLRKTLCNETLELGIRLRLYKTCVCSTLRYSSDAWVFTEAAKRRVNDFNSKRLAALTGYTAQEMAEDLPFCLVTAIWRTRLIWLGHILRYPAGIKLREVLLAYMGAFETGPGEYMDYPEGSLLEDAPRHHEVTELINFAVGDGTEKGKKEGRKRWKLHVAQSCDSLDINSGESRWSSDSGPLTVVDVIK